MPVVVVMTAIVARVWTKVSAISALVPRVRSMHRWAVLPPKPVPEEALDNICTPQALDAMEKRLATLKRVDLTPHSKRHAAILLPLCLNKEGQPCVLFTLRSEHLNRHGGQVSFPGGMVDDDDETVEAAAARECLEEIGIAPKRILGRWHDVTAKDKTLSVTPVIGYLGTVYPEDITPNLNEVAETFIVPCRDLLNPDMRSTWKAPGLGSLPQFDSGPHCIWGMTAYVLAGVFNSIILPYGSY
ncbi:hypothetical protein PTSG_02754 [Salpingoeca rosetta]|uniref:Nudix hydrolase domain-containing protein n=1 Tax=Salpingoeca rosetta (strain ATCC 50818 / BSB-021) TaxID=946362 RepID=F2U379_SALR5|nr:uncharacterized protein PTSG_02754 [Salpingoeca rosetta]EGD82073.1 hypothetical protein PTSG_02754 [Salpingoeca rosetta]|eukprot:XP_004996256.1 hypothetical protein PTSG_02754 [Salpingoeca rosetta]